MNNQPENEVQKSEEKPEEVSQDLRAEEVLERDIQEELEEITAPVAAPETRWERWLRLSIRWLAGILIVFGLGVFATVLLLYRPTIEELSRVRGELDQAQEKISGLENEVNRLRSLEVDRQALQEEVQQANLHIQILSALSDVNSARLNLANEEVASARVDLTNTPETLLRLEQLVGPEQRDAVTAMQDRLALAQGEMERDTFAAQSDLRVLATNLVQLENTFFAER